MSGPPRTAFAASLRSTNKKKFHLGVLDSCGVCDVLVANTTCRVESVNQKDGGTKDFTGGLEAATDTKDSVAILQRETQVETFWCYAHRLEVFIGLLRPDLAIHDTPYLDRATEYDIAKELFVRLPAGDMKYLLPAMAEEVAWYRRKAMKMESEGVASPRGKVHDFSPICEVVIGQTARKAGNTGIGNCWYQLPILLGVVLSVGFGCLLGQTY